MRCCPAGAGSHPGDPTPAGRGDRSIVWFRAGGSPTMACAWLAGSGADAALAPGGLHEPIGLAAPAGGVGARLLLGFGQQPGAGLLGFGAQAGELVLARATGRVELEGGRLAR